MPCQCTKPSTCLHTVRDLVRVQLYFTDFHMRLGLVLKYSGNIALSLKSTGMNTCGSEKAMQLNRSHGNVLCVL